MVEMLDIANGFQKTEVGVIPSDWRVVNLPEVGESLIGLTYSPSNVKPYGVLVLRSSNIQNERLSFIDNVFVEMDLPKRVIVKEGDILICVRNGSKRLIGKCAIIDKATEGSAFGAFMAIFRSTIAEYVFFQFQSNIIQRQINQSLGATINQITNKDLASFQIPLPPTKAEQTAIATALSDMDALIEAQEKLIAKKRNIKQGAMQDLLKSREGWEIADLGVLITSTQLGGNYPNNEVDNGVPLIKMGNLERGSITLKKIKFILSDTIPVKKDKLKYGDVIFNTRNTLELVGKVAVWRNELSEAYFNSNIMRFNFNPEKIESSFYMNYVLNSNKLITQLKCIATGTTSVAAIYTRDLFKIQIPLPPTKAQQTSIATALSNMDRDIQQLETQLSKYKMLKTGMMQELLTGKKRLA